jgi:hypothetical protein
MIPQMETLAIDAEAARPSPFREAQAAGIFAWIMGIGLALYCAFGPSGDLVGVAAGLGAVIAGGAFLQSSS